jgi:hypothetical protein
LIPSAVNVLMVAQVAVSLAVMAVVLVHVTPAVVEQAPAQAIAVLNV